MLVLLLELLLVLGRELELLLVLIGPLRLMLVRMLELAPPVDDHASHWSIS